MTGFTLLRARREGQELTMVAPNHSLDTSLTILRETLGDGWEYELEPRDDMNLPRSTP